MTTWWKQLKDYACKNKSHGVHINGPGSHDSTFFLIFPAKSAKQRNNKTAFANIAVIPDEDVCAVLQYWQVQTGVIPEDLCWDYSKCDWLFRPVNPVVRWYRWLATGVLENGDEARAGMRFWRTITFGRNMRVFRDLTPQLSILLFRNVWVKNMPLSTFHMICKRHVEYSEHVVNPCQ